MSPTVIDKNVSTLLSKMTLEEKVGQMTQISVEAFLKTANGVPVEPHVFDEEKLRDAFRKYKIGSLLNVGGNAQTLALWRTRIETIQKLALQERLKIPVLYGIDAIRGNNYTLDAVLFPQQIAQAASFNVVMAARAAEVAAYETRAAFIPWNFSPVLDLGRHPAWPRIWETYGEDPYLVKEMGNAVIRGYEGNSAIIDRYHVASCLKHYMGYSMPLSGHDRTPAWIPERELREYFLPQFASAINQGARTVMVNSGEINGVPVHANKHILTDILKGELGFEGFAVSDWQDIQYLYQRHKVAADNKEAVMIAINAGIDMSMVPTDFTFCDDLIALVKEGKVSMSRIDDAVGRILKVKYETGLFDQPVGDAKDYPLFNSREHNRLNYELAAECITLLKNDDHLLPLKKGTKILVAGPSATSMSALNGGWARNWQGTNSNETEKGKNNILKAISSVFGPENVVYSAGATFTQAAGIKDAVSKAPSADVIVLCIGEDSYTETPGNIDGLTISASQIELAKALAATGKPVVYVLTEGRPRVISEIEPLSKAVLQTYLLGNEGGNVVADVLAGVINPSGKLPYTYPRYTNSLTNYYHKYTESLEFDPAAGYNPQWEFGHGLSYTSFAYSDLKIKSSELRVGSPLTISVTVKNTGKVVGRETALLYVSDLVASITPEVKRLRGFQKVELKPGEARELTFRITSEELSFINNDLRRVTEPGAFRLSIGGLHAPFNFH
ncbi:glycoside hydrolase family 3 N-terminal domain-containing protein [Arcticibacter pallidicorallinus]|nr:glycoside hydrolase family 3 N-terminal domain-containing protein [Arcticibacter pallidicorallinus]